MEMASIDSVKDTKTATPAVKSKSSQLKAKIAQADKAYTAQVTKAQSETENAGSVSPATRSAGMAAANKFKDASNAYAAHLDSQNLASRAQVVRETGESRIASAEMTFNDVSSERIDAYDKRQEALRAAQKAYFADAKNDLSDSDKAALKSDLSSRVSKIQSNLTALLQTAMGLLNQIQSQVGGGIGGAAGCAAKSATSGQNPTDGVANLLGPVKSLVSLIKSMGSSVQGIQSDINAL